MRKGALRVAKGGERGRRMEPRRTPFRNSAPVSGPRFHQQKRRQSQSDRGMEEHATQKSHGRSRRRHRQAAGTNFRQLMCNLWMGFGGSW